MGGSAPERRRLALTVGDPAGIGPEIAAAVLLSGGAEAADLFVIGAAGGLDRILEGSGGGPLPRVTAGRASRHEGPFPVMIDVAGDIEVPAGGPGAEGGTVSGRAVETAAALAKEGSIEGIVTGPVSKEALRLAGYSYIGHTDMLAGLLDSPDCQMMMVSGDVRIVIMTRDIPLRRVPEAVTGERIRKAVSVTANALRRLWGIERPVIDVAALNPHAGDGGVTGTEEIEIIGPAIAELRGAGIDARGPFPADTLFHRPEKRGCDAFIALYHDQGMIPFKLTGFESGVNMTIGLPVVRTSVCHGTAYDLAGTGRASEGSLRAAIRLAVECSARIRAGSAGG